MSAGDTSAERAKTAREAIAAAPDLTIGQARELDRIMDRDAMGTPESQLRDPNAANWLLNQGLVRKQGAAFVATDDGCRAYVKHLKAGRAL